MALWDAENGAGPLAVVFHDDNGQYFILFHGAFKALGGVPCGIALWICDIRPMGIAGTMEVFLRMSSVRPVSLRIYSRGYGYSVASSF